MPLKPQTALGMQRVHVHRLGAVAPAGRHGERDAHAFAGELLGGAGGLGHAADAGVGDHALDRQPVGWRRFCADELGDGLGHAHRLPFERFAHALAPAVDGRTDADFRQLTHQAVYQRNRGWSLRGHGVESFLGGFGVQDPD